MLTDAFFRRYEDVALFPAYTEAVRRFLGQSAQIIGDELFPREKTRYKVEANDPGVKAQDTAHKKLARELGLDWLINPRFTHRWKAPNGTDLSQSYARTIDNQTRLYLTLAMPETSSPDLFIKFRISFIELCFQEKAGQLNARRALLEHSLRNSPEAIKLYDALQMGGPSWQSKEKSDIEKQRVVFDAATHELNERFRQAKIPLVYRSDLIQVSDDALLEAQVERPFWSIVTQPQWSNVDTLVKEAIDKRDRGERDAVTPAMQALESVIKIISGSKGWDTGNERGAANYINNLVVERDGQRFIEVWEKDALMDLFGKIRNAFGHGPGSDPLPKLRPEQTNWVIDNAMTWIKSLVRRC